MSQDLKENWNNKAADWDIQVGDEGDSNRILNSDPVLWQFAGDVSGLTVLDAGCGTGYLTRKLHKHGANAIGIDFSKKMIEIAQGKASTIDFRIDDCSKLETIEDGSVDMIIANYVLMDTPDLEGTMQAFSRVLKTGGVAIVIFSHPCFPQGQATASNDKDGISYHWQHSYFEQRKHSEPPRAHFKSKFIYFHRPLSDYWKAFKTSGFNLVDFEEPRLIKERYYLAENER